MPNKFYVYIYLNPLKPGKFTYGEFLSFGYEPFYIGKGSRKRLYDHLRSAKKLKENPDYKCNKHLCYTILKIQNNGYTPIIIKLNFNLKECKSHAFEKFYIKTIGRRDLNLGPLTNHNDGGREGINLTESIREILSQKGKLRFESLEERKRISDLVKKSFEENNTYIKIKEGIKQFYEDENNIERIEENKKKRSERMKDLDVREKISIANKKRFLDPMERKKQSRKGKRTPHKEETKKKIGNANKGKLAGNKHPNYGKHLSIETRLKISIANTGKQPSEETLQKLSDTHKGQVPWNKGKSKYPDIDLNQEIYCLCGCGEKIILKPFHKYDGIPSYLRNHHPKNGDKKK